MDVAAPKADLYHYLQTARGTLLWKLDGLSEYDVRRPMTQTSTNLLGIVKHVANRHAGHADIVRELIDGTVGHRVDNTNVPDFDAAWWQAYRDRVEAAARQAADT
jgi:Protein of unknown function (DUF664)